MLTSNLADKSLAKVAIDRGFIEKERKKHRHPQPLANEIPLLSSVLI